RKCLEESSLILILMEFFVDEKEEGPIVAIVQLRYPYGPADAAAVVVPAVLGPEQMAIPATGERKSGSQVFVHKVFKRAAVKLVGSRFGNQVEHAPAHLAVFGREIGGLHRNLLQRLHGWLDLVLPIHQA